VVDTIDFYIQHYLTNYLRRHRLFVYVPDVKGIKIDQDFFSESCDRLESEHYALSPASTPRTAPENLCFLTFHKETVFGVIIIMLQCSANNKDAFLITFFMGFVVIS
jgi:hypothetical protein